MYAPYKIVLSNSEFKVHLVKSRFGRKGVNLENSLMAAGVCCRGSKDEDVIKYFGKKICLPLPNLIWDLCTKLLK